VEDGSSKVGRSSVGDAPLSTALAVTEEAYVDAKRSKVSSTSLRCEMIISMGKTPARLFAHHLLAPLASCDLPR
jgi:hypothetical protein